MSGSTAFPAGANTPVDVLNRALLEVGTPVSSLAWTTPSMLASVQHDVPVQVPLLALDPNVSLVTVNRPLRLSASVSRVL